MRRGNSRAGGSRWLLLGALTTLLLALLAGGALGVTGSGSSSPKLLPGTTYPVLDEEAEGELFEQDQAFVAGRTAGDDPLDIAHAGQLRAKAAHDAKQLGKGAPPSGPATFSGAWAPTGPSPTGQYQRSDFALKAVSGRIGALAVRPSTGQVILGAAQGGIWRYDNGRWTPRTNNQETQSVGALALAPSDDAIVYAGTGEGAMSGDSYFGNGILRSSDGGGTWSKGSGDYFQGVSVSLIEADPDNPDVVFAAGEYGYDLSPQSGGIFRSDDGGQTWKNLGWDQHPDFHALAIDPAHPAHVLVGNDGGVRYSADRGGRPHPPHPPSAGTWQKLDGPVDPNTAPVTH